MTLRMSLPSEVKIDPKRQKFIDSDKPDCGKEFSPSLCVLKHKGARAKQNCGKTGFNLCAYCPTIITYLENNATVEKKEPPVIQEIKPVAATRKKERKPQKMPKILICTSCGDPADHKKVGLCHKCYNNRWYHANREKAAATNAKYRKQKQLQKNIKNQPPGEIIVCDQKSIIEQISDQLGQLAKIAEMMTSAMTLAQEALKRGAGNV